MTNLERMAMANQYLEDHRVATVAGYIKKVSGDNEMTSGHVFLAHALVRDDTVRNMFKALLGLGEL